MAAAAKAAKATTKPSAEVMRARLAAKLASESAAKQLLHQINLKRLIMKDY
jgi:hypothetical protein